MKKQSVLSDSSSFKTPLILLAMMPLIWIPSSQLNAAENFAFNGKSQNGEIMLAQAAERSPRFNLSLPEVPGLPCKAYYARGGSGAAAYIEVRSNERQCAGVVGTYYWNPSLGLYCKNRYDCSTNSLHSIPAP